MVKINVSIELTIEAETEQEAFDELKKDYGVDSDCINLDPEFENDEEEIKFYDLSWDQLK